MYKKLLYFGAILGWQDLASTVGFSGLPGICMHAIEKQVQTSVGNKTVWQNKQTDTLSNTLILVSSQTAGFNEGRSTLVDGSTWCVSLLWYFGSEVLFLYEIFQSLKYLWYFNYPLCAAFHFWSTFGTFKYLYFGGSTSSSASHYELPGLLKYFLSSRIICFVWPWSPISCVCCDYSRYLSDVSASQLPNVPRHLGCFQLRSHSCLPIRPQGLLCGDFWVSSKTFDARKWRPPRPRLCPQVPGRITVWKKMLRI